jgi:hypothetical protein
MLMGYRFGGRQKGTLNRATIEKREMAAREAAQKLHRNMVAGKVSNQLAKEVLEEWMVLFRDLAAAYQPTAPAVEAANPEKKNRHANDAKFEKYATLSMLAASKLIAYQSPTMKAIGITAHQINMSGDPNEDQAIRYPTPAEVRARLKGLGYPSLRELMAKDDDEILEGEMLED